MTQEEEYGLLPAPVSRRRPLGRGVLEVIGILLAFAGAGLGAGWLWETRWTPVRGVVIDGAWYSGTRVEGDLAVSDFPGLRHYFDATASFVVIGVLVALVLGVVVALAASTSEIAVLVALSAGSVLGCAIAYRWGVHLGPAAPDTLATSSANGTVLEADLAVKGHSPFASWPFGALLGAGATYFVTAGLAESRRRERDDSRWLSRNQIG